VCGIWRCSLRISFLPIPPIPLTKWPQRRGYSIFGTLLWLLPFQIILANQIDVVSNLPYSACILDLVTFVRLFFNSLLCSFAVISCGNLTDPRNGHVNVESTRYQGIAKYECDSGYELSGEDVLTCQISEQWSGTPPQCIGKFLSQPTHLVVYGFRTNNIIVLL